MDVSELAEFDGSEAAVLTGGGLDSAVLLAEVADRARSVLPICVRTGSVWETVEHRALSAFIAALAHPRIAHPHVLELPMGDVYGDHWSTTARNVPDADSADEAVYLPGRNVVLLSKAMILCRLRGIARIGMAPLNANPFPDATDAFFHQFTEAVNRAIEGRIRILRPYGRLDKAEVIRRGARLPLERTFSCIRPVEEIHCGRCNKCAERQRAFAWAGVADRTRYALPAE